MADYSMQPDPLNAFAKGFSTTNALRQHSAKRQAGNALAGGDRQGAVNMLNRAGMLEEAEGLQDDGGDDMKGVATKLDVLGKVAKTLRAVPFEHRPQALASYRETLAGIGVPPDLIAQFESGDLSDQALDMFAGKMEEGRWQIMQRRDGSVVGVNQGSLEHKEVLPALPAATMNRNVPFGWDVDEEGNPVIEESFVRGKAKLAGATRAPARGRSGGGRRGGGGSSGLPAGFVLD